MRSLRVTLAALATSFVVAGAATAASPSAPPDPTEPTKGACAYTPLEDTTYSTIVPLPRDPHHTPDRGKVRIVLKTNQGDIPMVLDRSMAPCTVQSFQHLTKLRYFDDTICHRLTTYPTLSVLQCGDPLGTGWGDPGYSYRDELPDWLAPWPDDPTGERKIYPRGTLAMANGGPDTNGSQFFLVYKDSRLRPHYNVFGWITPEGMAVLDKIAAGGVDPADPGAPLDGLPAIDTELERVRPGR